MRHQTEEGAGTWCESIDQSHPASIDLIQIPVLESMLSSSHHKCAGTSYDLLCRMVKVESLAGTGKNWERIPGEVWLTGWFALILILIFHCSLIFCFFSFLKGIELLCRWERNVFVSSSARPTYTEKSTIKISVSSLKIHHVQAVCVCVHACARACVLVYTCLCLCSFKPGVRIWDLMWGSVVVFMCAQVETFKIKKENIQKKHMDKCIRLSNCVCVWVRVRVHAWRGISECVLGSQRQRRPAGSSLSRHPSGLQPPSWHLEVIRATKTHNNAITVHHTVSEDIFFSPLPSSDVPVSFILMVRKSLCCDKTGSILEEGNKWQRLAAAAVAALDESKRLLLARGLFLKDIWWDFCCRIK